MPSDLEIPELSYRQFRRPAGLDAATRRLLLIAGGLGGALLLIVVGWMTLGHHQGGVPLVMADTRPIRVKPANPGGMQVIGANEDVMAGDGTTGDKVAPAPESPDPQALQAQIAAAKEAEAATAPQAATPSAPASMNAPAASASPASQAPLAATTAPAVAPAAAPNPASNPGLAAAPSAAAPAPHAVGGTQVQLAALDSQQAAMGEWDRLQHRAPGLLDGHAPVVEKIARDGKTYFRLRTGGFPSTAAAAEFCARMRAKGGGCSIAAF